VYRGVNLRLLSLAGQVGVMMVVFILIGLAVGLWVDGRFGTSPTFTLVFIFLGIGAAAWSTARLVMWALEGTSGELAGRED
jgi:ATP synthase protein I